MLLNRDRADRIMDQHGLDALIATGRENTKYFSGLWIQYQWIKTGVDVFVILPRDRSKPSIAIIPSVDIEAAAEETLWVDQVWHYGHFARLVAPGWLESQQDRTVSRLVAEAPHRPTADAALSDALVELGLSRARIGVDETNLTHARFEALVGLVSPASIKPAQQIIREIRMIKTPEEIQRLRQASAIITAGMEAVWQAARPGVSERALVSALNTTVAAMGANPGHWCIGAGTRSAYPHHKHDGHEYVLRPGDWLRCEIGCQYRNYHADTARTRVLGRPSDPQVRIADAVRSGVQAAVEAVRPGVHVADLFERAVATTRRMGFPDFHRSMVGHGMGIEIYDPPYIAPTTGFDLPPVGMVIEENMVLNLESAYYRVGFGGYSIEDTVLVTANGFEYLTTAGRDLELMDIRR